jgi:hypothetical protein
MKSYDIYIKYKALDFLDLLAVFPLVCLKRKPAEDRKCGLRVLQLFLKHGSFSVEG